MPDPSTRLAARALWATLFFGGFALVVGLYLADLPLVTDLDELVGAWPQATTSEYQWLAQFWLVVSAATTFLPQLTLVLLAVIWLVAKGHARAGQYTALVGAVAWAAFGGFKALIARPRPEWSDPITEVGGWAMPSGHATMIVAHMTVAFIVAGMLIRRAGLRRLAQSVAVGFAVLVCLDRIFLGVHYPSDVLAGAFLGLGVATLGLVVLDPTPKPTASKRAATDSRAALGSRLGVVLNPMKVEDPDQFRAMVEKLAHHSGYQEVSWFYTTPEDTGYSMAHEAAVAESDVVLAVGGDGTVRAVCEELAGTGIPVGIVPAGTGNLLARNLEIPLYLRRAVDIGLNGQDRAIDMVRVGGDNMDDAVFLVMAGMGFDAAIMEGVDEDTKAKIGWLAYVSSAVRASMFPAMKVTVAVDDEEPVEHRARTVVIGNVGYLQAGVPLIPDAAIDDGALDVVILHPQSFLGWVPLAARVLRKSPKSDDLVMRKRGKRVVVTAERDAPRQLDGDTVAEGRELRAETVHGRLLVRVPRKDLKA